MSGGDSKLATMERLISLAENVCREYGHLRHRDTPLSELCERAIKDMRETVRTYAEKPEWALFWFRGTLSHLVDNIVDALAVEEARRIAPKGFYKAFESDEIVAERYVYHTDGEPERKVYTVPKYPVQFYDGRTGEVVEVVFRDREEQRRFIKHLQKRGFWRVGIVNAHLPISLINPQTKDEIDLQEVVLKKHPKLAKILQELESL